MAASSVQNPAAPADAKSAKKKKVKAGRTESPAPAAASEKAVSVAPNDASGDDSGEPGYLRELSKCVPVPLEDSCTSALDGPKRQWNSLTCV